MSEKRDKVHTLLLILILVNTLISIVLGLITLFIWVKVIDGLKIIVNLFGG